jgi:hypothetical protein
MKYTLPLGLLLLVSVSCQSNQTAKVTPPPQVEHVVLFWLKNPGDAAGRQRIIEATKTFTVIPGVLSVSVGPAVPSTRPVVDSTFDVGIVIRFKDRESMNAYEPHPIHTKAVTEILMPLARQVKVYDVEVK